MPRTIANYKRLLDGIELLAIDEAQNIPEIGQKLKLIVDEISGIKVLASGSSSFDLLSKVFVVYRLGGFSRNLRKEISKSAKWYFYDNGIRNALIGGFGPITQRKDIGQLWENYLEFISD